MTSTEIGLRSSINVAQVRLAAKILSGREDLLTGQLASTIACRLASFL